MKIFLTMTTLFVFYSNYFLTAFDIEDLTLEEKVGQLLMPCFRGEQINETARALTQEIKVGGIIYYNWSNNLSSLEQVRQLSEGLQGLAQENRLPIPLLIAADQEGGMVARLTGDGFTIFPGNRALAMTGLPELAWKSAYAIGKELLNAGINMNLAPVIDLDTNHNNPVIGIRSYGATPQTVSIFGEQALLGYAKAGILTTLKHFPGHGNTHVDSHQELPVINLSIDDLEEAEILPFKNLAHLSDAVMVAHLLVPALDTNLCSTLSERTLNILREKIGFNGVIISDSLTMKGVLTQALDEAEAAIMALKAGCDILLFGGRTLNENEGVTELSIEEIRNIHQAIVAGVRTGDISERRVSQAAEKVLAMKRRYRQSIPFDRNENLEEHQAMAATIASLALKVDARDLERFLPLSEKTIALIAPLILKKAIQKTSFTQLGKRLIPLYFANSDISPDEIQALEEQANSFDALIICTYNAWRSPSQQKLIQTLLNGQKPVMLVVTKDPNDALLFPFTQLTFTTYSPTIPSLQAVVKWLETFSGTTQ